MRVLIVEPDRSLATTLRDYLVRHDYEVAVAHSAQTAVSAADEAPPDVVVLELAMHRHNGVAFLQEFRSYTDWIRVPVVVYSHIPIADTGLNTAQWEKQGVVEFLYKPTTSLVQLQKAIARVVDR